MINEKINKVMYEFREKQNDIMYKQIISNQRRIIKLKELKYPIILKICKLRTNEADKLKWIKIVDECILDWERAISTVIKVNNNNKKIKNIC